MIYTQYGVPVKITKVINREDGQVEVTAINHPSKPGLQDPQDRPSWTVERHISQLRAGSINEILFAMDECEGASDAHN